MKILLLLVCLIFFGCSSSKETITKSKVETYVRKSFNKENFRDGGVTNEKDAWGNDIVWDLVNGTMSYILIVRSPGSDGLLYTSDDIVAKGKFSKYDGLPGLLEELARSTSRGKTKGIKEGLLEK